MKFYDIKRFSTLEKERLKVRAQTND